MDPQKCASIGLLTHPVILQYLHFYFSSAYFTVVFNVFQMPNKSRKPLGQSGVQLRSPQNNGWYGKHETAVQTSFILSGVVHEHKGLMCLLIFTVKKILGIIWRMSLFQFFHLLSSYSINNRMIFGINYLCLFGCKREVNHLGR